MRLRLAMFWVVLVGAGLVGLEAVHGTGLLAAPPAKQSDPQAAARAQVARELKRSARATSKKIKVAGKNGVREMKALGKAVRTGKRLDRFLPAAVQGPRAKDSLDPEVVFQLVDIMEFLFVETNGGIDEIIEMDVHEADRIVDRVAAAHDVAPHELAIGSGNGPGDAWSRTVGEAAAKSREKLADATEDTISILQEVGTYRGLIVGLHPPPRTPGVVRPGADSTPAYAFSDPVVILEASDGSGNVQIVVSIPSGTLPIDADLSVFFAPIGEPESDVEMTPTTEYDPWAWNFGLTDVAAGIYEYRVLVEEEDQDCCVDRGVLIVPQSPPPDDGPGDPTDCVIENGAELLYEIDPGAPMAIDALELGEVSLMSYFTSEFVFPRIMVSNDRSRLYFVEMSYAEDGDQGTAFLSIDFGDAGVPLAGTISLGPESPGSSFFSSFPPGGGFSIDLASPITPDHELRGTICLDVDSIARGATDASVGVEFIGDIVDRMGNRDVIGSISGRMGHLRRVHVETR